MGGGFESEHRKVTSDVSERIDTNDTIVAFAPRVSPRMQPFANAGSEPSTRRATRRVLSSSVLFLANDGISCKKKSDFGPTNDGTTIGRRRRSRKMMAL